MKITPYVEKLNHSPEYASFLKDYKDAFVVAGFFVLDFDTGKNIHQIDYYIPKERKVAAFTLDEKVVMQKLSLMSRKVPEKLDLKTKTDLEALKGILEDEMKNRNITEEIRKIIAVIQTLEGKKIWTLNCVLSGMGILRASIEDESQTVLKMEKSSIFDYIKRIPAGQLAAMPGTQGAAVQGAQPGTAGGQPSQEAIGNELKKLDALEKEIEIEKAELQKKLEKAPASAKEMKEGKKGKGKKAAA